MARSPATRRAPAPDDNAAEKAYSAADIEVLEGLEPVRRRPGMYIGGTDERALHHLAAEVLDNSMDEAVAGHATRIEVTLEAGNRVTVRDNGRGIPVDPHPKNKRKSALEVIMTTLHAGGKFGGKAYETSGGLHGVGISVVNALASELEVEVVRSKKVYRQTFARGLPTSKLKQDGTAQNRRGTSVSFIPDPDIFGKKAQMKPARLYRMARSKSYLFGGVEIRWSCNPSLLSDGDDTPAEAVLHFPGGLKDFLEERLKGADTVTEAPFHGTFKNSEGAGAVEWAIAWVGGRDGFLNSYCNTVPTPQGGAHEQGLRNALTKGLRGYGELVGVKKAQILTADDSLGSSFAMLSVFIREPEFQGQTKERLSSPEATRLTESAVRDAFDHWLAAAPAQARRLLDWTIDRAEDRLRRKQEKEISRKTATRRLRLPGKLADCARQGAAGTELFLVEGDSAGGSAKQARNRDTQAVLPLRGKVLNVASAAAGKIRQNQELSDLIQALGCGYGSQYSSDNLRYEKVIIMTDADVDGAHIAALLMTFFYKEMPDLIADGRLYLAIPPLYRLTQGGTTLYARDDAHKDRLVKSGFKGRGKIEVGRFKGLGEMMPAQLRDTTMKPGKRTLLRVTIPSDEAEGTGALVDQLMGRRPELRFQYIQENASLVPELDI